MLETNLSNELSKYKSVQNTKGSKKMLNVLILILVLVLIGGLTFASVYFYDKYETLKDNPNKIAQDEVSTLTSEIEKLMELPDETPTIATVTDKEKLKDQDFFKNCENDDKVLVYINAKKAILYRPSAKKIIEVAPLILSDDGSGDDVTNNSGLESETTEE